MSVEPAGRPFNSSPLISTNTDSDSSDSPSQSNEEVEIQQQSEIALEFDKSFNYSNAIDFGFDPKKEGKEIEKLAKNPVAVREFPYLKKYVKNGGFKNGVIKLLFAIKVNDLNRKLNGQGPIINTSVDKMVGFTVDNVYRKKIMQVDREDLDFKIFNADKNKKREQFKGLQFGRTSRIDYDISKIVDEAYARKFPNRNGLSDAERIHKLAFREINDKKSSSTSRKRKDRSSDNQPKVKKARHGDRSTHVIQPSNNNSRNINYHNPHDSGALQQPITMSAANEVIQLPLPSQATVDRRIARQELSDLIKVKVDDYGKSLFQALIFDEEIRSQIFTAIGKTVDFSTQESFEKDFFFSIREAIVINQITHTTIIKIDLDDVVAPYEYERDLLNTIEEASREAREYYKRTYLSSGETPFSPQTNSEDSHADLDFIYKHLGKTSSNANSVNVALPNITHPQPSRNDTSEKRIDPEYVNPTSPNEQDQGRRLTDIDPEYFSPFSLNEQGQSSWLADIDSEHFNPTSLNEQGKSSRLAHTDKKTTPVQSKTPQQEGLSLALSRNFDPYEYPSKLEEFTDPNYWQQNLEATGTSNFETNEDLSISNLDVNRSLSEPAPTSVNVETGDALYFDENPLE
jgi:hypothetical protein